MSDGQVLRGQDQGREDDAGAGAGSLAGCGGGSTGRGLRIMPLNSFYRIVQAGGGLVDVYLTPGEVVPMYDNLTGRMDYGIRLLAVRGIDPKDPEWAGNLEEHIRRHYAMWLAGAEEIEI